MTQGVMSGGFMSANRHFLFHVCKLEVELVSLLDEFRVKQVIVYNMFIALHFRLAIVNARQYRNV